MYSPMAAMAAITFSPRPVELEDLFTGLPAPQRIAAERAEKPGQSSAAMATVKRIQAAQAPSTQAAARAFETLAAKL